MDWRFPFEPAPTKGIEASALSRFAGAYRPTRYPHRTIAKLSALMSTIEVTAENGALVTELPERKRWLQEQPLLFREARKSNTLAFGEDDEGRITHAFVSEIPVVAFERAPVTETPAFVGATLGGGLMLTVLAVLFGAARVLHTPALWREARSRATNPNLGAFFGVGRKPAASLVCDRSRPGDDRAHGCRLRPIYRRTDIVLASATGGAARRFGRPRCAPRVESGPSHVSWASRFHARVASNARRRMAALGVEPGMAGLARGFRRPTAPICGTSKP